VYVAIESKAIDISDGFYLDYQLSQAVVPMPTAPGLTTRVSVNSARMPANNAGLQVHHGSFNAALSADGRFVTSDPCCKTTDGL
jgi:hypothetical protein